MSADDDVWDDGSGGGGGDMDDDGGAADGESKDGFVDLSKGGSKSWARPALAQIDVKTDSIGSFAPVSDT